MAEEFSFDLAIRRIALRSVLKPDQESHLRAIYRWYSERFSTPLAEVPYLSMDHVLQNFWEWKYERMKPEEREQERLDLIEDPEVRKARIRAEEEDDVDAEVFRIETEQEELVAAANKLKAAAKRLQDIQLGKIEKSLVDLTDKKNPPKLVPELDELQPLTPTQPPARTTMPLPPDIQFNFDPPDINEKELGVTEDELENLSTFKQPPKAK